ncbi:MAG: ABC transporter substrate-binding protein [Actinobacteria bacterium]|jgi:NitT/TauT family transport system substrate-binding protein|nr:ABC transporter substrate-binding protein [Actinomycetota bacterium]
MRVRTVLSRRLVAVTSAAVLLAACGTGGSDATGGETEQAAEGAQPDAVGDGELSTVRVSLLPTVTKAPMYLGMEKGFFAEEGLNVEENVVQSGAAVTAAVMSGEAHFASSALVPTVTAADKGLDVRVVMTAASATPPDAPTDAYGDSVIIVAEDSDIQSIADLNGTTIAVNALQAGLELAVRGTVDRLGGDSDTIEFLPVPFPEMVTALNDGHVDAIAPLEPFVSSATAAGHRVLHHAFPYDPDETGEFVNSVYFTSGVYADENPEIVAAFRRAIERSNAYAEEHPDEVRSMIPIYTGISEEVAAKIALPSYPSVMDLDAYRAEIELMAYYGFISGPVDEARFYLD